MIGKQESNFKTPPYSNPSKRQITNNKIFTDAPILQSYIADYLKNETERFNIRNPLDLEKQDRYEVLGINQSILRQKIEDEYGERGLFILSQQLQTHSDVLEKKKWAKLPVAFFLHEFKVNPAFKIPEESCAISPNQDLELAITALSQPNPDYIPILKILGQIRDEISCFSFSTDTKSETAERIKKLAEQFSQSEMLTLIKSESASGFYSIIIELLEKIRELELHDSLLATGSEIREYQKSLFNKFNTDEDQLKLLKSSIEFCFSRLSKLEHHVYDSFCKESRLRHVDSVEFEREYTGAFQIPKLPSKMQSILEKPERYKLEKRLLCSEYSATYITHALILDLLRTTAPLRLNDIPEYFTMDVERIIRWHQQYQYLFYTAVGVNVYRQLRGVACSEQELVSVKDTILTRLKAQVITNADEATTLLIDILNSHFLKNAKRQLNDTELGALTLLQKICRGNHCVADLIMKSLSDNLGRFLFKGYLPEDDYSKGKSSHFTTELISLGQSILPILRHHIRVNGLTYQKMVEAELWKSVIYKVLTHSSDPLYLALEPEQLALLNRTRTSLQNIAYLLQDLRKTHLMGS